MKLDERKGKKTVAFLLEKKKRNHISFALLFKEEEAIDSSDDTKRHKRVMSSSSATAYNTLGVRTRAQKRRMGERDVWDVIVNNDDICFKHILPRLNVTDVKFLYEVNTETRKLIKRSSRAGDLKEMFKVREMSSISTLEVAWEHYPWGTYDHDREVEMWEPYFCWKVAQTNKLELLKWAREEKKCEWSAVTIDTAAEHGNLEMIKYCVANECPFSDMTVLYAHYNDHAECVQYLVENNCPLRKGWRYEHGTLYERVHTNSY